MTTAVHQNDWDAAASTIPRKHQGAGQAAGQPQHRPFGGQGEHADQGDAEHRAQLDTTSGDSRSGSSRLPVTVSPSSPNQINGVIR